ncbi:MAG: ATPase, T2SS/T4P/T4SS family [Aestuariivita sp.]|nr:ATPase, T2SS/T4P/T4SS family [Aestuariivita sp.]MCY4345396.1 ATPase, T2SS/T4P/T4SS family [Aestuariivita sp.]
MALATATLRAPERLADRLAEFLGPLAEILAQPNVIEISANPDGVVYVDRFGAGRQRWGEIPASSVERFLRWCASSTDTTITETNPRLKGRIPGTAHRIAGLIPPVVDAPMFSIRRHLETVIALDAYVRFAEPLDLINSALRDRRNILIAGATGAGKTTLLNACLAEIAEFAPATRLIVIEDTPEIRHPLADHVAMRTSDTVGMDDLLVDTLRHAPTRIIVGEVRTGPVLMTLLKAWNTGHPGGLVTLHANSAGEVMDRLWTLGTEVMTADPTPALLQATDTIVFVQRSRQGPPEIAAISQRVGFGTESKMETVYEISN